MPIAWVSSSCFTVLDTKVDANWSVKEDGNKDRIVSPAKYRPPTLPRLSPIVSIGIRQADNWLKQYREVYATLAKSNASRPAYSPPQNAIIDY